MEIQNKPRIIISFMVEHDSGTQGQLPLIFFTVTVRRNLQTLQFFPFQPWWQKQVPSPLIPSLQVPLTQLHSERKAASCKILKELVSKTNFDAEWVALKRKKRGGTEGVLSAYASSVCWSCKASAHYVILSFWIGLRWLFHFINSVNNYTTIFVTKVDQCDVTG